MTDFARTLLKSQRNTGTWTPYSRTENAAIEAAFNSGVDTIEVPTCFNAVVHFNRQGGHHHQMTPAVGTKPPGFRSVLRGVAGQSSTLYWHGSLWRLELPDDGVTYQQDVLVTQPASEESFVWQWCDLTGRAAADAREINWHPYAHEHAAEVRAARRLAAARAPPADERACARLHANATRLGAGAHAPLCSRSCSYVRPVHLRARASARGRLRARGRSSAPRSSPSA